MDISAVGNRQVNQAQSLPSVDFFIVNNLLQFYYKKMKKW